MVRVPIFDPRPLRLQSQVHQILPVAAVQALALKDSTKELRQPAFVGFQQLVQQGQGDVVVHDERVRQQRQQRLVSAAFHGGFDRKLLVILDSANNAPHTGRQLSERQRLDAALVDDAGSLTWRRSFIRSYLERDVPMFAPRLPAETIGRLWTMLAHAQGAPLNQSRIASSLAVSAPAVARYIDLLVDLLLVRRLRPWSGNIGKRLVRAPKIYIRDSGLTHALLELESWEDILGHPVAGPSWEGFVIENLIAAAGDRRTPYYYRTEDGAEVDLVFERGGRVEMAVEIKRSSAPVLSRGFHSACEVLKPKEAYLLHGGNETWPIAKGSTAIGLQKLLRHVAKK